MSNPLVSSEPLLLDHAIERLRALGYPVPDPPAPEDIAGTLETLQADFGLPVTGEPDAETWVVLLSSTPRPSSPLSFGGEPVPEPPPEPSLTPGEPGPLLDEVQLRLRALGHETGGEDVFGPRTQAALAAFQHSRYLEADGLLDADTLFALRHATREAGPLFFYAPPEALEDQSGPLVFGLASREVAGTGGYVYRQYEDGAVEIAASPQGALTGRTLRQGAAWRAIVAEIGPFPTGMPRILQAGSKGEGVRALQRRLNALGFGPLAADGEFGQATATALRRFQAAAGLPVTGVQDAATEARLADPWPTLRSGDTGAEVRLCQERLRALGFRVTMVDGEYGPETEAAVRAFQQRHSLPGTGAIDAITRGHILGAEAVGLPDALVLAERERLRGLVAESVAALPADAQGKVQAVLEEAVRWFGLREIPQGSNGGPEIGPITADFVRPGEDLPPWCALAVSHWLKVGLGAASWAETPLGFRNASALAFGRWGEQKGRLLAASGPAPAGSIFVMYRAGSGSDAADKRAASAAKWDGKGHTGLVLQDLGDAVLTIDGNVSDRCWTARRLKSSLLGFVRWW